MLSKSHLSLPAFRRLDAWSQFDWLSRGEHQHWKSQANPRQRELWLAGRWLAKSLVAGVIPGIGDLARLHLESKDGRGRPCPPRAYLDGKLLDLSLSLSHAEAWVMTVAGAANCQVGCDVARLEKQSAGFSRFWLSRAERRWVRSQGHHASASVAWALKEACYKALGDSCAFVPKQWDSIALLRMLGVEPPPFRQWSGCRRCRLAGEKAELQIEIDEDDRLIKVALCVSCRAFAGRQARRLWQAA